MTCVATDWSKLGIGFLVTQKHCDLPSGKCYPVDCEAFGVVWSLENARMLTLGCPDLLGTVPHQSLIPILGDWNMPDILNQRLYRLQRSVSGLVQDSVPSWENYIILPRRRTTSPNSMSMTSLTQSWGPLSVLLYSQCDRVLCQHCRQEL